MTIANMKQKYRSASRKFYLSLAILASTTGIVIGSSGTALAAATQVYVTSKSQSNIWVQYENATQGSLRPYDTGYNVKYLYTGPGWCTQIIYSGNPTKYFSIGGSGGDWYLLAGGRATVQSWKGCWG